MAALFGPDQQLLLATDNNLIDVNNPNYVANGVLWWLELTESGGEGMAVKPIDFITKGKKRLNQPAVKCRGREYLRIIYRPDYDTDFNLKRLRNRHLGRKRSLAIREFALGIEALERLGRKEPLRRVHECVFGVLALESEPVGLRLYTSSRNEPPRKFRGTRKLYLSLSAECQCKYMNDFLLNAYWTPRR